jgi:hypothetical protein
LDLIPLLVIGEIGWLLTAIGGKIVWPDTFNYLFGEALNAPAVSL